LNRYNKPTKLPQTYTPPQTETETDTGTETKTEHLPNTVLLWDRKAEGGFPGSSSFPNRLALLIRSIQGL